MIKHLLRFSRRVVRSFLHNHGILLAGGVGYNALLSMVPFFAITITAILSTQQVDTNFSGSVTLSGVESDDTTPVTIQHTPLSIVFTNGEATVDVTVLQAIQQMKLPSLFSNH